MAKATSGRVVKSGGDRTARLVISTADVDRAGDVICPEGLRLDAYRANPVLLLGHEPEALVGHVRDLRLEPGRRLVGEGVFHAETPLARQAWELVRQGFLKGVSIGFQPDAGASFPLPPTRSGRQGREVRSAELLEVSLTPLPCNPSALVQLKSMLGSGRLCGEPLAPPITKSLERIMKSKPRRDEDPLDKYRLSNDKPGATPADEDGDGALDLYDRIQAENEANIAEFVAGRHPESPGRAAGLAGRPGVPAINLDDLSLLGVQVLADVIRQLTEAIDQAVGKLETRPAAAQKFLRLRTSGEGYGAVAKAEQAAHRLLASVRKLRRAGRPVELKAQPTAAEIKEAVGAAVAGVAPIVRQFEQMIRRRLGQ